MLEPLIVLTVINCVFMFGTTLTSCALWWQYRNTHRSSKSDPYRSRSACGCGSARKVVKSSPGKVIGRIGPNKSGTAVDRESSPKRNPWKKSRTNLKYLSRYSARPKQNVAVVSQPTVESHRERTMQSEASQTANDAKSAVVMEFATVPKVVQILDDESDFGKARLIIKNRTPTDQENGVEQTRERGVTLRAPVPTIN